MVVNERISKSRLITIMLIRKLVFLFNSSLLGKIHIWFGRTLQEEEEEEKEEKPFYPSVKNRLSEKKSNKCLMKFLENKQHKDVCIVWLAVSD